MDASNCELNEERDDFERSLLEAGRSVLKNLESQFGSVLRAQDLEDCLSDALLRYWIKRHEVNRERGPLAAWLYVTARNRAIDLIRRKSRELRANKSKSLAEWSGPPTAAPENLDQGNRLLRDLHHIVHEELSPVDRAIVLAWGEVGGSGSWAQQLALSGLVGDLSSGAIRVRKLRVMQTIRQALLERGHDLPMVTGPESPPGKEEVGDD